jgi:hypothetical protein
VDPDERRDFRFPPLLLIRGRPFVVGVGKGLVHDVPHEKAGLVFDRLDDAFHVGIAPRSELGLERVRIQTVPIPQNGDRREAQPLGGANVVPETADVSLRVPLGLIVQPDARAVQVDALCIAKVPFQDCLVGGHAAINAPDEAVVLQGLLRLRRPNRRREGNSREYRRRVFITCLTCLPGTVQRRADSRCDE